MVGSIGRGAGIGALSNGVSNMCVTTIDYLAEHGNLNGALDDIAMSGFSGVVSGGITGGISGGAQFAKVRNVANIQKGIRPNPKKYLSKRYINKHLSKFNDGASVIQTEWAYSRYSKSNGFVGVPDDNSLFVMPKNYCDEIISKADGDISIIEESLGFPKGYFSDGGGLVRIDVDDISKINIRIPSGNETGANNLWIPGGFTSGGVPEAITDIIPLNDTIITRLTVNN